MRNIRALLAYGICSVIAMPSYAYANWNNTTWGMSYNNTLSLYLDKARIFSESEVTAMSTFKGSTCKFSVDNYAIATFNFKAVFCFDDKNSLASVVLYDSGNEFHNIDRALHSSFGAPISQHDGSIPVRMWADKSKGNTIRLLNLGDSIIEYKPIVSGF